ncbi:hypothetical protein [Adhaeretor mobilis]|uniref:Uncharacterized protein n=1 Tax=Adhaeretor mobilis TaxID=1930276 RepID=A0A517MZU6_9BACT|nr:hypothetical protein [Adhaeretor mobilis]QDT00407.1 hypothetical protein HG15A2_37430 [Adhaeretor mobilis]
MTTTSELGKLQAQFGDVAEYIGNRLSAANPCVVALISKWPTGDLVPGLSDMDFRVVCDKTTTASDWVQIDWHVGRIHREMVEHHPEWNRINEHTPGAGISLTELDHERLHHPEYSVWNVWWGSGEWLSRLKSRTLPRPLCAIDEQYHLARFLTYYSPYIHGIDPPINLGAYEPKYALHSRCWHYYAPPMLSAATLLARRHFVGKRESLRWLIENDFAKRQTQAMLQQVDAHYDTPELSDPSRLDRFEQLLWTGFQELFEPVCRSVEHLELPSPFSLVDLKQQVNDLTVDPLMELLENVRFLRIRASRCYFYLNAPAHFSANLQLVQEQPWMQKLVTRTLQLLCRLLGGQGRSFEECMDVLGVDLDQQQRSALRFVTTLTATPTSDTKLRENFAAAVEILPHYSRTMEQAFSILSMRSDGAVGKQREGSLIRLDAVHKTAKSSIISMPGLEPKPSENF